jgi:hypothetical protein
MKAIDDPESIDEFLDKRIAQSQKRVEIAIRKLEQKILTLVDQYNQGEKVAARIKIARDFQKQAIKDFELFYNSEIQGLIDFVTIDAFVIDLYGNNLANASANALKTAVGTTLEGYNSVASETLARLNQEILDYSIAGKTRQEMQDAIRGILSGTKDVLGKDMSVRSKTFVQDAIMKYHNTANLLLSEQAGIKYFKYFGSIIETTREFCRDHLNEVRTREEWEQIGQQNWAGKAPGGIMLSVGGYGCRHHFVPVLKK